MSKYSYTGSGSLTSREHYESILQHLVSFASLFVSIFGMQIFLLAEVEMAKCSGERKVWQLGQVSVLLNTKQIGFLYQCEKLTLFILAKPHDFPWRLQFPPGAQIYYTSPTLWQNYTLLYTLSPSNYHICFWHSRACCVLFRCASSSSLSEMDKWRGERISFKFQTL